jgi:hypothetical protein
VAYLFGVTIVVGLLSLKQKNWPKRFAWGASRYLVVMAVVMMTMVTFGEDIYDRFLQVMEGYPVIRDNYRRVDESRKWLVEDYIPLTLGLKAPEVEKPKNAIDLDEARVIVVSDTNPEPARPSDVYEDIPDLVEVATLSADGTWTITKIEKQRTFSDAAFKYGLSLAIRLDTLWPQAIDGFNRNPLLGSGYATLNKESINQFTEADSTDNNFLRTLGETGMLGFITFYGVVAVALWFAYRGYKTEDQLLIALSVGYAGSALGLLFNALYIDVFAASKVAFIFWAVTGMLIAYFQIWQDDQPKTQKKKA